MGDQYMMDLICAYCGKPNCDIYYAESAGSTEFICENCQKVNKIIETFKAVKKN